MMRPCATCAHVCCVRLGSWSVACPPFPLCMSLCRVPCIRRLKALRAALAARSAAAGAGWTEHLERASAGSMAAAAR
eukprot:3378191-Prymnesium_polylepis.1